MNSDYEALAEAIRDLVEDLSEATHFIVNPADVEGIDLAKQLDDETGDPYLVIEGFRVFVDEECPPGLIGACVPDVPLLSSTTVGIA